MILAHRTAHDMARSLATYIACPDTIRKEVLTVFDRAPHVSTIRRYRKQFVRNLHGNINDYDRHVVASDRYYAEAMLRGSEMLRERVNAALAPRIARETETRRRNDAARRDIWLGKHRGWIMREHGLSETAYEQLAGHVRAGWTGDEA